MENFDDFMKTIPQARLDEWYNRFDTKAEELSLNYPSQERTVNLSMTLKLLREYHEWLHSS